MNRRWRSKERKQVTHLQTDLQKSRFINGLEVIEQLSTNKTLTCPLNREEKTKVKETDDDGFFGPALPPGFKKQQSSPER